MKAFAKLKLWISRAWRTQAKSQSDPDPKDPSLSNFPTPAQNNMLALLPSEILANVDSYIGERDKFNLRMTCKGMRAMVEEYRQDIYRPHYLPTKLVKSSNVRYTIPFASLDCPLFPKRFSTSTILKSYQIVESKINLAPACWVCNHTIPSSAITLPSSTYYDTRSHKPVLNMRKDHVCFYARKQSYTESDVSGLRSICFKPADATIATNIIEWTSPTKCTSHIVTCCGRACLQKLGLATIQKGSPAAVFGLEVTHMERLVNQHVGIETSMMFYFTPHVVLLSEFANTSLTLRNFSFRLSDFFQVPPVYKPMYLIFNSYLKVAVQSAQPSCIGWQKKWQNLYDRPRRPRLSSSEKMGILKHFPEIEMDAGVYADFLDNFPRSRPVLPFFYTTEAGGFEYATHLVYSLSIMLHHRFSGQWCSDAYLADFGLSAIDSYRIMRNTRANLLYHLGESPLEVGTIRIIDQPYKILFEYYSLEAEEEILEIFSTTEEEDLMTTDTEEGEEGEEGEGEDNADL